MSAPVPAIHGGEDRYVLTLWSDNYRDSFRGTHPLIVVRGSREDAVGFRDAFCMVEPSANGHFRLTSVKTWDELSAAERIAATTVAERFAEAASTVTRIPLRGGGEAADVVRADAARRVGVSADIFDFHLAARDVARRAGLTIVDGIAPPDAMALPTTPSPTTTSVDAPTLDLAADPRDHGIGEPRPLPAEPSKPDRVPDEVLATYADAGEAESETGYYVRAMFVRESFAGPDATPRESYLTHTDRLSVATRLASILGRDRTPDEHGYPRFDVVFADRLDPDDRFLIDERRRERRPTGIENDLITRATARRAKLEREADAEDIARADVASEALPAPRADDPIVIVDAAADALATLVQSFYARDTVGGQTKIDAACRAFQYAAADVLARHGQQGTIGDYGDPLASLRDAAGAAGRSLEDYAFGVRDRAAGELVNLRRELLVAASRAATIDAGQSVMFPPVAEDVAATLARWTPADRDAARDLLASTMSADVDARPDPANRDAPAKERATPTATHSDDFTSVDWFGTRYTFAAGQQARSVAKLWAQLHGDRWHAIAQRTIGEAVESASENFKLSAVFRDHPAWGTMIVMERPGHYRLRRPDEATPVVVGEAA